MGNIIFKCPRTGFNVQSWVENAPPGEPECTFETVNCLACAGLHFINRSTGKVLGQNELPH
jgi:hypothetical protein